MFSEPFRSTFTVDLIVKLKRMKLRARIGIYIIGMFFLTPVAAQEGTDSTDSTSIADSSEVNEESKSTAPVQLPGVSAENGRHYFDGSKRFDNGGPACITCHNINHKKMIPGGLFAKDLTDVYERMGEGITGWLSAPPFPAMASAYQNHELTERERASLTEFFKEASEAKEKPKSAMNYFVIGGLSGLGAILVLINILWWKRKRQMVKKDIFLRQKKAWDAKH